MATLAYCLKKMGKNFDPGTAKHLRDLTEDYKDMDMAKGEAEVQAVQDVLDMLDKEYASVVGQLDNRMKKEILRIETTPGRWFNFEFARNNIPKLQARITQLQKMFWDSDTFAKSDIYDGSYPIPVAGGIITARQTKKYTTDPEYKGKVDSAIKEIQDNLIGANHTRMILMGNPDPAGQWGVKFSVGKVSAGYGVNVARAWNNEAKSKYPYTDRLGNVAVREGIQNSLDATLEALENGEIKKGTIDIYAYNRVEHPSDSSDYSVRNRKIDMKELDGTAPKDFRVYDSFEIVDNGVGMSDTDIRDKFLALHGTGKDQVGRFGGFGIAKAVILGPHESAIWMLETRDNWHDGARAQEADVVGTLPEPRQGTSIRVETNSHTVDQDAVRYAETTEYPNNIEAKFNGKKLVNPFARRKSTDFPSVVNPGENQSDLEIKYYPKSPPGYNRKMLIRLVDKQTGAKLTQGINDIYNDGFIGTIIIDVTTTQTPGGNAYPLTDSRMELKWDGKKLADEIVAKFSVDPLSAKRSGVESKWYNLKDRSEWKKTVANTKTDKGYNDLVKVITGIWNEAQKAPEKLTIEDQLSRPYLEQTIPFTPIEDLNIKIDVGFKGYKGGSMFHAKHLLAFETIARMYANSAHAKLEKFYPLMSMPVDGGVVEGEYNGGTGSMGVNPLSIDKDATKSPLHYAFYLKGLIDHEFTHSKHGKHDENFAVFREEMHKGTAHLFPQTLKIAEAALQMPDKALTRDKIINEEKIKEIIKEFEVPVETIRTEYKPLPMKQGMLFDPDTLIHEPQGVTPYEIKLYFPSRTKGIPRQLRLFDQRVVGRSPGRVSPAEPTRDRGVSELPDPQAVVQSGKRSGAFDGIDLTRAEAEVAQKAHVDTLRTLTKGIEYEYWGIPKGSSAGKVLSGDLNIVNASPAVFTVSELHGLLRILGGKESGTKAEMKAQIIKLMDLANALEDATVGQDPVAFIAKLKKSQLQSYAALLGASPVGSRQKIADSVWRKYVQGRYHSIKGYVQFFEDIKKPIPNDIADMWLEAQDLFHTTWGDALTVKIPEFATAVNPDFEKGGLVSTGELFDALAETDPKLTKARFDRMIKDRLRQDLILYRTQNPEQLAGDDLKRLIKIDGVYYGQVGKKKVSTIDVADLVVKIDSPSLIEAIRSVTERPLRRDLGTQLGILGAEYPSIKKALSAASDKLKLRQAQAAAEADTDTQLSLLEVEATLAAAKDFMDAFAGEKTSMSKVADAYINQEPVKNESIIRQVFYGEMPVRIEGPIEQYMATRQTKEEYRKRYMHDQGITLDDIKRLFKGTNVFKGEDGSVSVTTPSGHQLKIKSVDSIDINNAKFMVNVGRVPKTGETAIGKYSDGVIEIHKDLANNWTLTHETAHWLEDVGLLTPSEVDVLRNHIQQLHEENKWEPKNLKDVGGSEDRANYIAWSINNRAKNTSIISKIVQKVKDLIDGFVGMFKLTPQSIVRDIETGKVYQDSKQEPFGTVFLDPMFREKTHRDEGEQYTTATPQDQEFMKEHGNSAAAEHVSRSLRDYTMLSWGKIGRWMHRMREIGIGENQDTTAWERLLFTPIHYFNKVPAAGAMVEDGTNRSDNYYKGLNWIEKDSNGKSRLQIGKKLKKTNKKEYKRLNKYLDDNDMNKCGYTVRLAPQTEESTDRVYNIKDPEGNIVGTADDYDDGWGEATRLEVAKLAEQGYSDLAQDWVQSTREMTHNVFNIMRGAINDLIKRYNTKGLDLPKVATWVDGQRVEVDLKVALAKMGDMRGHYMPRVRKPGNWSLYAKPRKGFEDKLHPVLKHFELKSFAAAEASKKMYDNYIVDVVPLNKMPEDVFQIAGQVVAFQEMMNQAMEQVSSNMKKGVAADVMKTLERAQLEMGRQLAEGVANVFKGRGVRSHMIMRNDAVGTGVWKGYEEDSIQRMAKYVRGIAAGEAKKKMMLDMLRHMTGTDISWSEFKAEHAKAGLEANYPDYLTFVKNRRIDPIKQRNIFHDALTYMEDMGRNDEGVDRFVGTVKGLAVLKYLAGRVSAPIVNLTALATSVPASMRAFAKIPMRKTPGLLVDALKGWREYHRALKNGNDADIPGWQQRMYEEIEDRGWHTAQYNKEALSVLKSKVGNQYDNMIEWLMMGFGATETVNRMSTIAGAYIGQRKMNQKDWDAAGVEKREVLHKEWMRTAKEVSDKAHGVYSKANRPHYARGANPMARLAQMFYVFKTFSHNYLQTMYDLGFKSKDRTALLYMALAPALIGGASSSLLIKAMIEAFGLLPGAPEEPEEALYEWFENNFGEPVEQVVRLGAFGLGGHGVSLKGSLEIGIFDIPTSLKDLAGAPGSLVSDVVVGGKSILRGDWSKGLERMSPNFIGSGIKAWREATIGVTTSSNAPLFYGRDPVKLDWVEALYRGLSFNPARIAKIRERQWKERSVDRSMSELRYDIYARIKAYYSRPKSKRSKARYLKILEEIRTYNALIKRMGKPYPVITHQSIKNNLRRAFRPSKYERLRGTG